MALRIRFQYPTGAQLGYSIERLADGSLYDFTGGTFVASPTTPIAKLPEDTGIFAGRFKMTMTPTPAAQFTDGDYAITVHDQASSNNVVCELAAVMHGGDDATVIPSASSSSGGTAVDPWAIVLPGSYAAGTAGAILGQNLDARVSTRSTYAGGPVASVTAPVSLPATAPSGYGGAGLTASQVQSACVGAIQATPVSLPTTAPSGYGGTGLTASQVQSACVGAIQATPVIVGTNTDKAGYALAASGFDAIQVESGVNARQALSPILAASAGVVAGAGTGVIVIKGGNSSTTRITAATDNAGNRSSVTLTLPS